MPDLGPSRVPEFVPLCEKCGYVIESLPQDSDCPECGRPIASSLPEARIGSVWQAYRGPALARWIATADEICCRPSDVFVRIHIGDARDPALMRWSLLVASATLATVLTGAILLDPGARMSFAGKAALESLMWLTLLPTSLLVLRGLTWVEERGLRFFGRRQGFRITPAVAKSVCAHAAVGWALGALLGAVATIALHLLLFWPGDMASHIQTLHGGRPMPTWGADALGLAFGAGAALLWFETLAYIGMRKCRYANRGAGRGESGEGEAEAEIGAKSPSADPIQSPTPRNDPPEETP
ncbi:MAG: hypothetical protein JJU33_04380 [Phycisphaerales bacterium]|nr:hypothetical protein [Phycisphaerales bacterium]